MSILSAVDLILLVISLKEIIDRSLSDGGTILIPAFSVGRTQELLFDIEQLIHEHKLDSKLPIILDSPMAQKVTLSYQKFRSLWGEEAKQRLKMHRHPLAFEQCITVGDHQAHQELVNRLVSTGEPAIVDEEEVSVNAHIHTMSGYSAHADSDDLLKFVEGIPNKPKQIHLIHGEFESKQAFANILRSKGYEVVE